MKVIDTKDILKEDVGDYKTNGYLQMNYIHYTYKITNIINGKYYFGKHSQEFGKIDNYFGSGVIISRAIEKYGRSNFIKEVLEFFSSEREAFEAEKNLLNESVLLDEYCYNIYPGGKGAPNGEKHPMFNKLSVYDKNNKLIIITREEYYLNKELYRTTQLRKITIYDENGNKIFIDKENYDPVIHRSIYKGIKLSNSAKEKLKLNSSLIDSVCVIDTNGGFALVSKEEYKTGNYISSHYGKKHSDETKNKISIANKGKKHSDEAKQKISKSLIAKFSKSSKKTKNEKVKIKKHHTDITKNKISKSLSGRKLSDDHKNKVCTNLDRRRKVLINGIEFASVKDATIYCKSILNISQKTMKKRLNDGSFENWSYIDKVLY